MPPIRNAPGHASHGTPYLRGDPTNGAGVPSGQIAHIPSCEVLGPRHRGTPPLYALLARCHCPAKPPVSELVPEYLQDDAHAYLDYSGDPGASYGIFVPPRPEPTAEILAGSIPAALGDAMSLADILTAIEASQLSDDGVRVALAV